MESMANASAPKAWSVLDLHERRLLGVLVEKAKTTPDTYPLSLNALVTGCNQKSNRDPVLNLSDAEVEHALASLQKKGLVFRLQGSGRVERWRHVVYEAWKVDKVELAVLAELLLRGAQTEGELRGRASRMEPIDDLDQLRAVVERLAERRLVEYVTPEGRRGTVLTHGFHAPGELERLRVQQAGGSESIHEDHVRAGPPTSPEWQPVKDDIAAIKAKLAELENKIAAQERDIQGLKGGLGL